MTVELCPICGAHPPVMDFHRLVHDTTEENLVDAAAPLDERRSLDLVMRTMQEDLYRRDPLPETLYRVSARGEDDTAKRWSFEAYTIASRDGSLDREPLVVVRCGTDGCGRRLGRVWRTQWGPLLVRETERADWPWRLLNLGGDDISFMFVCKRHGRTEVTRSTLLAEADKALRSKTRTHFA